MQTFKLKIITPEKIFFEGDAEQIIAKTTAGYVGILAGHTPYVAKLVPSALKVKAEGSDECRIAAVSADVPPESEPFVPAESAGTRRRNDGRAASGSDGADEILQTSESIDVRR